MPRPRKQPPKGLEQPDSVEAVFRAFLGTSGLLRSKMRDYFGRFGISGAQWGVLRVLRRAEQEGRDGVRLTDIGRSMLITPPSVTGVINRLERLGWVVRKISPDDQRARVVTLTDSGRQLIENVMQGHRARVHMVMAGLSADELRDLHRLLDQLASHLEQIPPA